DEVGDDSGVGRRAPALREQRGHRGGGRGVDRHDRVRPERIEQRPEPSGAQARDAQGQRRVARHPVAERVADAPEPGRAAEPLAGVGWRITPFSLADTEGCPEKNELTRPYPSPTLHPVCDGTGGGFVSSRASSLWVLSRYGLAVILAGLAFLTSLGLAPHWSQHHLLLPFYPAVILSAWFGGFGAGLLTTLLSGVAITSLYLSPAHSLTIRDPGDLVGVLLFVSVGLLVSAMNARLLDAQCRAESVARELRREIEERRTLEAVSAKLATIADELYTSAERYRQQIARLGGVCRPRRDGRIVECS